MLNLREEHGRGAFRNETPYKVRVAQYLLDAPVPMPPVLGDTVLYLDLSKWNWPIDLTVAYDRGIRVVFIKVSQGAWVDSRFEQIVQAAQDAGMLIGFYHFIDPTQTSVSPEQAAAQAANLTDGIGDLSMWMDVEWRGNKTPSQLLDYLIRWHGAYKSIDDRMIEVYTRHSMFTSSVAPSSFWRNNNIGLNSARYHLGLSSPWSDGRYVPRDWIVTELDFRRKHWQYSADGNGLGEYFGSSGAVSMDLNLFRGNFDQMKSYYGLNGGTEPPPPPPEEECLWSFLNIRRVRYRTEPSNRSDDTIVGYIDPGDIIDAKRVVIPNGYQVWLVFEQEGTTFYSALVHYGMIFYDPI